MFPFSRYLAFFFVSRFAFYATDQPIDQPSCVWVRMRMSTHQPIDQPSHAYEYACVWVRIWSFGGMSSNQLTDQLNIANLCKSTICMLRCSQNRTRPWFLMLHQAPPTPRWTNHSFIQRRCHPTVHAHRMATSNVPIRPLLMMIRGWTVVGFVLVLELADVWHAIS